MVRSEALISGPRSYNGANVKLLFHAFFQPSWTEMLEDLCMRFGIPSFCMGSGDIVTPSVTLQDCAAGDSKLSRVEADYGAGRWGMVEMTMCHVD